MPVNIGTQTAEYTLASNDIYFLAQSDTVITDAGSINGIVNDSQIGAELVIAGTIIAGNVGARGNGGADNMSIMVTSTGVVIGQRYGLAADNGTDDMSITNHGTVAG